MPSALLRTAFGMLDSFLGGLKSFCLATHSLVLGETSLVGFGLVLGPLVPCLHRSCPLGGILSSLGANFVAPFLNSDCCFGVLGLGVEGMKLLLSFCWG